MMVNILIYCVVAAAAMMLIRSLGKERNGGSVMSQSYITNRKDVLILELVSIASRLKNINKEAEEIEKRVSDIILMLNVLKEIDEEALRNSENGMEFEEFVVLFGEWFESESLIQCIKIRRFSPTATIMKRGKHIISDGIQVNYIL